jgi:hypothetical protein
MFGYTMKTKYTNLVIFTQWKPNIQIFDIKILTFEFEFWIFLFDEMSPVKKMLIGMLEKLHISHRKVQATYSIKVL